MLLTRSIYCECEHSYPPGGCCGIGNTFKGFYFGILAANYQCGPCAHTDSGQLIENNYADVDITGMNNAVITKIHFQKPPILAKRFALPHVPRPTTFTWTNAQVIT